ncbi:MAG TPA: IS66 family transposase [Planctomycetaceae bacterium]|jgi:transposase|nr:IS66 family transposase [Planctomycetaceae bacterium]
MITPEAWPTDPGECHTLLNRLNQQVEDLQTALEEAANLHDQATQEHKQTVEELRRQLELYRRYVFGPRRERLIEAPGQGHLFELDALESVALPPEPPVHDQPRPARPRPSRKPDYDRLPQIRIEHDVPEADKVCTHCGESKARIGEDEARVLEFIPARFELQVHVLPKYACSHCRDGVVAPEPPARPLSGCIAGAGLLAQVGVSKFAEHLPLYRFEDISTRYGLHLSRSTLCDWVRGLADLLKPLYQLEKELVQSSPVIWTDDTHVTVLGGEKPGSHKGRFWVYIGAGAFPYDVYDFTEDRKRDGPARFLANYQGYLQADAFSGYDGIYVGSGGLILEVACWAHARRKFFEARSSFPAEASLILQMIRRLYEVEDRARSLDNDARRALRQAESVPILERLREELDRLSSRLLPKSALAQAVTYASNQWRALCRYTEDGRLTIDNNVSERRLRDQAIGRKNWMFLGSDEAGPRAAVLCTIIAGAKRHRLEPWAYLRDVILQLSVDASPELLAGLLPDRWAVTHPEHILNHRLEESRQKAQRRDQRRANRRWLM